MYNGYGFGSLVNQNNVNTNYSSQVPTMPGYAGIDKLKFADMRSPQDQIHWLYLYALQLSQEFITREEAEALIEAATDAMKAYSDEQDAKQDEAFKLDQARQDADVLKRYYYLLDLINETGKFNGSCFDPTIGYARNIKKVLERVYDFDRVFALTAGDWDGDYKLTASEFDSQGTNARDYDVNYALLHYNDSRKTATTTPQSTYFIRMLKRMIGGEGGGSILTFNAPLKQDGEDIKLGIDNPLYVNDADNLGISSMGYGTMGVATLNAVSSDIAAYAGERAVPVRLDEANQFLGIGITTDDTHLTTDAKGNLISKTPIASATTLGEVKIGDGITVADDGTISASSGSEVNIIAPLVVEDGEDTPTAGTSTSIAIGAASIADNTGSVAVGASAQATQSGSIAIGNGVSAAGTYSVSLGAYSKATQNVGIAIGCGANCSAAAAQAIGASSLASAIDAIAIGNNARSSANYSMAIGGNAKAQEWSSVAIGTNAVSSGTNGIAIGDAAKAQASGSIAIGSTSVSTRNGEFSVGNAGTNFTRFLSNVTAPELDTDAANKKYVDDAVAGSNPIIRCCITSDNFDDSNSYITVALYDGTYTLLAANLMYGSSTQSLTIGEIATDFEFGEKALDTSEVSVAVYTPTNGQMDDEVTVSRAMMKLGSVNGKLALVVANQPITVASGYPVSLTF